MLEEEYERQNEGLNNFENPFQAWAISVHNESKSFIEEGTGINPFYCPSLVPIIIKCFKLLPFWSGVMVPIFGFGDEVASSAAVESSFKKLKTLTFKNITLPTSVEIFLENHIDSLKGTSLIRGSTYLNRNPSPSEQSDLSNTQSDFDNVSLDLSNLSEHENQNINEDNITSILSYSPEHQNQNTYDDQQNNLNEEALACESWNRKTKKQRKGNSYLVPNPHLKHLNLNSSRNIKSLPILKNGSRAEELKAITVNNIGKIVLTNTCAFDTVTSVFTVAYCDSILYSNEIDKILDSSDFFCFISKIVKHGITASTYSERANIILKQLHPEIRKLSTINLVICDSTATSIFQGMLSELPSVEELVTCANKNCKNNKKISVLNLTYNTTGDLSELQNYVLSRINKESSICGYTDGTNVCQELKIRTTTASNLHLIIEILKWAEGLKKN